MKTLARVAHLVCVTWCAAQLVAQDAQDAPHRRGYDVAPNQQAIVLMPELRTAPAPAWIEPGMRLSYLVRDAFVPRSRYTVNLGPDGWSQMENSASASGQGIEEIDVLAVPDDCVVVNYLTRLLNPDGTTNITSLVGGPTTAGDAIDAWIHPDVLRRYVGPEQQGVRCFRTPYEAAGKRFDAVWRQVTTGSGSITDVYDIASGLRLHHAECAQTAQVALDIGVNANGAMMLSQRTLVGMRKVATPWSRGRLPKAATELRELVYEGSLDTLLPGTPPMRSPEQVRLLRVGIGGDFVVMRRTGASWIGNARTDMAVRDIARGPLSMTPWVVEPGDLAKLQQGQELDRDPVTRLVTRVSWIGRDAAGRNVVVIRIGTPGRSDQQSQDYSYDLATGLCVGMRSTLPALHQVETLALVRRG